MAVGDLNQMTGPASIIQQFLYWLLSLWVNLVCVGWLVGFEKLFYLW